jgi:hypothetical protein
MAVDLYLNVVVYAFDSVPISFSFKIVVASGFVEVLELVFGGWVYPAFLDRVEGY